MFEGLIHKVKNWEVKQKEKSGQGKVELMNPAHQDVKEMRYQMQLDGVKVSDQNKLLGEMAREERIKAEKAYQEVTEKELQKVRKELAGKNTSRDEAEQQVTTLKRRQEITGKHYELDPREPYHQVNTEDYPNSLFDSSEDDK